MELKDLTKKQQIFFHFLPSFKVGMYKEIAKTVFDNDDFPGFFTLIEEMKEQIAQGRVKELTKALSATGYMLLQEVIEEKMIRVIKIDVEKRQIYDVVIEKTPFAAASLLKSKDIWLFSTSGLKEGNDIYMGECNEENGVKGIFVLNNKSYQGHCIVVGYDYENRWKSTDLKVADIKVKFYRDENHLLANNF